MDACEQMVHASLGWAKACVTFRERKRIGASERSVFMRGSAGFIYESESLGRCVRLAIGRWQIEALGS